MTNGPVANAYGARASEYAGKLGTMDAVAEPDLHLVRSWACSLVGPVIDAGCGPGHWTAYLHGQGVDISGIDPTHELVDHARATYPGVNFTHGCAERLDVPDETLGGVLAWYSLVHSTPEQVSEALIKFARALRPGAGLIIGFFEGPVFAPSNMRSPPRTGGLSAPSATSLLRLASR